MREVRGFLPVRMDPEALEGLDDTEKAELQAAKDQQQSCIRRFLSIEPGMACSSSKVYRTATFRFLQALDSAVHAVTGFGLEQFATADTDLIVIMQPLREQIDTFVAGSPRACLTVADQFSCGPSGFSFLQSEGQRLLVDLLFDPPHRFWNFEKLGLLHGDGWEAILLTTIPYVVNDGPWQGAGGLQQLLMAKDEYVAMHSVFCFSRLLLKMLSRCVWACVG